MDGWRHRQARRARPLCVDVEAGTDEAIRYLDRRGGEAVTLGPLDDGGYVIYFRAKTPTASAILEEFSHVLQSVRGDFADRPLGEMRALREIEVGECLERNATQLGLSDAERKVTQALLGSNRSELDRLEAWR
jgi:hypothetical protein